MFLLDRASTTSAVVYSPTDIVAASCPFLLLRTLDAKLGRAGDLETTPNPMLERAAVLGNAHEARVLAAYQEQFGHFDGVNPGGVAVIGSESRSPRTTMGPDQEATFAALRAGADVVFQATFFDGRFHGRADFLVKVPGSTPGRRGYPRYTVVDTKLTEQSRASALLQLAGYADQLLAHGVEVDEHVMIHHGSGQRSGHLLADLLEVFRAERHLVQSLLDAHQRQEEPVAWDDWRDPAGSPALLATLPAELEVRRRACGRCDACTPEVERSGDVRGVHGISGLQRTRLYGAGVRTVTALGALTDPVPRINPEVLTRLRRQARLQLGQQQRIAAAQEAGYLIGPGLRVMTAEGSVLAEHDPAAAARFEPIVHAEVIDPHVLTLLPAPSPGDIYFDFEGDPMWTSTGALEGGLEYLFGLVEEGKQEKYVAFWAHDRPTERLALRDFLRYLRERRAQYPDLHVYHYAAYEKSALERLAERHGEGIEEVLALIQQGVLVDLYPVVRHAVAVSQPSYSIKKLEPLYMGAELRDADGVTSGGDSVVRYAEAVAARDRGAVAESDAILAEIADYNRYDCVSTRRLVQWLRSLAHDGGANLARDGGGSGAGPAAGNAAAGAAAASAAHAAHADGAPPPRVTGASLLAAALAHAAGEPPRDADREALALLGAALGYHRREDAPVWREHFARLAFPLDWWADTRDVMTVDRPGDHATAGEPAGSWQLQRSNYRRRITLHGALGAGSTPESWQEVRLLYRAQDVPGVTPGPGALYLETAARVVEAAASEDARHARIVLEESAGPAHATGLGARAIPVAVVPGPPIRTAPIRNALEALAQQVTGLDPLALEAQAHRALAAGQPPEVATAPVPIQPFLPALPGIDLLRRAAPRLRGLAGLPPVQDGDYITAITRATAALDSSVLAVQGPPGTGKTYIGARVITRLVRELGWRIGVVAQSHAVVEHLLDEVVEAGLDPLQVAKHKRAPSAKDLAADPGLLGETWTVLGRDAHADYLAQHAGEGCVIGGTMWDFTNRRRIGLGQLDLLVVDEAGQFSLANTVAAATAAQRLLLLGDPQQLPQVTQGTHPEPVDQSSLGWIAAGEATLPASHGYFIERTWRMHSALCQAVSEFAYDGRLQPQRDQTDTRFLAALGPGIHVRRLIHHGNASASPEEALEVLRLTRSLLGTPWREAATADPRPVQARDIIVVAPYNAQVALVRAAMDAAGLPGVRVGTVDKFQGQQAAIAVVTLAASSAQDIPRGLGFLLNRNRLNVAVSRGQWAAVVIHSAALSDVIPTDGAALADLGAFLRLTGADAAHPRVPAPLGQLPAP